MHGRILAHGPAWGNRLGRPSRLPQPYEQLIPAFQKTEAGEGTTFSQSYGASGDQSRAVQNGLAADVVTRALEPDMTKLVDAGLVAKGWNAGPTRGMITRSVVVFIVRKGNPKASRPGTT